MCCGAVKRVKLLFLGDHGVGKTCTTLAATVGHYPSRYIPSADFENWYHGIAVDGVDYTVDVAEAPGRDCHEEKRVLAFVGTPEPAVLLICFDVTNRGSFESVEKKWLPEVKHHAPYLPIVLVANKIDLWNSNDRAKDVISAEEGRSLAQRLGLCSYLECSALTHEGIPDILPTAIRIYQQSKGTTRCRKFAHRFKVVCSNKPTFNRFMKSVLPCFKDNYFVYCSRSYCVFHMRYDNSAPLSRDYPNCYCRQRDNQKL